MKVLIKSIRPHRQKILTNDGEEVRLQQWANKKAAESLRTAGGDASGEQFTQARDMLMRDAVENPEEHGLKFMNERVPFEGQNLESSLSDPMSAEDIADITDASSAETERAMGGTPDLFDSEGKLRDGLPPEEEEIDQMTSEQQRGFDANKEAEHLRRIMTSRDVAIRDAWSVLKNYTAEQTREAMSQHMNDGLTPEELEMMRYKHVRDQNLSCRGCGKQLDRGDLEYGACLNCHTSTAEASQ